MSPEGGKENPASTAPDDPVILVDFAPKAGLKEVSLSPGDLAARSAAALDNAMASVRKLSERITETTSGIAHRPDEIAVEFGLKLDASGGALLARAGAETHLVITLHWKGSCNRDHAS